jgi:hypothetical protein
MSNTNYTVLSTSAIVFDRDGYIKTQGVQVCDLGDTVTIGATEHSKSDLTIAADSITSVHGWIVKL